MKVLLIGDFSSLHKVLKDGLIELGISTTLISNGDGWKRIKADINVNSKHKGILGEMEASYKYLKCLKELKGYDVVQIINVNTLPRLIFHFLIRFLRKNNSKLFVSASGDDVQFINNIKNMRYSPYQDIEKKPYRRVSDRLRNYIMLNNVNGVIPVMYEYAEAYRKSKYCSMLLRTIPLPIKVRKNSEKYLTKETDNKRLTVFHGINREEFKGTKYITAAMKKLKENYPNDVEIVIDGKMPLNKYLEVLNDTDVVIDQALSYSYAMNALYAMALGKVVLSGNEKECKKEFKIYNIPVINIMPSTEHIYKELEKLVLDKNSVVEIGKKSREFVEDFHSHIKIAKQYVDVWNSVEVEKI